jgi:hypothetical protein
MKEGGGVTLTDYSGTHGAPEPVSESATHIGAVHSLIKRTSNPFNRSCTGFFALTQASFSHRSATQSNKKPTHPFFCDPSHRAICAPRREVGREANAFSDLISGRARHLRQR